MPSMGEMLCKTEVSMVSVLGAGRIVLLVVIVGAATGDYGLTTGYPFARPAKHLQRYWSQKS